MPVDPNEIDIVANPFCEKADVIAWFSLRGVIHGSDHEQTGVADDNLVNRAMARASQDIASVLFPRYKLSALASSNQVTQWAATIAAYYLAGTRANPVADQLCSEFYKLMGPEGTGVGGLLDKFRIGRLTLIGVLPQATSYPVWSNLEVDRRFFDEKIRVTSSSSSQIDQQDIEEDRGVSNIFE